MKTSVAIWIGVGVLVVCGLAAALLLAPNAATPEADRTAETTQAPPVSEAEEGEQNEAKAEGRYVDYEASAVGAEGYDETILFFHAAWCPECRAFEAAINESSIPEGVQILKVDYDTSTELRQQHGVTLQSTFVSVSDDGAKVSSWVGYGKDKSVDAILENL